MWAEVNGELVNLGVIKQFNEKDKLLHAPMANLGDLTYDADAVYVNIPDSAVRCSERASNLS